MILEQNSEDNREKLQRQVMQLQQQVSQLQAAAAAHPASPPEKREKLKLAVKHNVEELDRLRGELTSAVSNVCGHVYCVVVVSDFVRR